MSERHLDDAIDRVVREIMNVDPRPGLSRRVLARLETAPRAWLTIPRFAAASAVVLLIAAAAALLVTRPPAPLQEHASALRETPPATMPVPHIERVAPDVLNETSARVRPARTTRAPHPAHRLEHVIEDIPPFVSSVLVAPLADIAPITVAPSGPNPLEAPEVIVAPLAPIDPVRVDPLSSLPR